jgi:hypothetical protein
MAILELPLFVIAIRHAAAAAAAAAAALLPAYSPAISLRYTAYISIAFWSAILLKDRNYKREIEQSQLTRSSAKANFLALLLCCTY